MPTSIAYLDGPRLNRCLQAGLRHLIGDREQLNRINVFPVADGDTGNNLAHTARAALQAISMDSDRAAGHLLVKLADAALDEAQGNSGVILAQYFQGVATSLSDTQRISTEQFASALKEAAVMTRAALDAPREGTILTVMDSAADAAAKLSDCDDFAQLLPGIVNAAEKTLSRTPEQLPELRRANVVDAGGRGFCALLRGCNEYLQRGSLRDLPEPIPEEAAEVFSHMDHDPTPNFRYCTECLVAGTDLSGETVRQQVRELGDSIVIAGSASRLRLHIHTDDPEHIFELAMQWGDVLTKKADDMVAQAQSLASADRDVAVVTDSGADIPETLIRELGIHVVPLRVLFGDDSHLDKTGISPAELAKMMRNSPDRPGTSQPTPGDFRRMYEFLGTHFGEIISIHLSGKLSGTLDGARATAEQCTHSKRIAVLDAGTVSVGQGLVVRSAAEAAAAGLRGPELQARIVQAADSMRSFALVTDLTNAVRSGRLKPGIKRVADWLRITPVLADTHDGRIVAHRFIRGRRNLTARFARRIAKSVPVLNRAAGWEIAVGHGINGAENADRLWQELKKQLPESRLIWKTEIGAALGVHAGMDALIVAMLPSRSATQKPDR